MNNAQVFGVAVGRAVRAINPASFPTMAVARLAHVPASLDLVTLRSYASPGDGGRSQWRRVVAQPTHAAWFQDVTGAYFEYLPDKGFVRPAAFGDGFAGLRIAWDYCTALGLDYNIKPTVGVNYTVTSTLAAAGRSVRFLGRWSTFTFPAGVRLINPVGSWGTEIPVTAIIAPNIVQVSTLDGLAAGDTIKIMADAPLPDYTRVANRLGEFATIWSIDVPNKRVRFSLPLYYEQAAYGAYTAALASNLRLSRLNPDIVCHIEVGNCVLPEGQSFQIMIQPQALKGAFVKVWRADYAAGYLIRPVSCISSRFEIVDVGRTNDPNNSTGYGVVFAGSEYCSALVRSARHIRHALDAGAVATSVADAVGPAQYGAAAYNEGRLIIGVGSSEAMAVTHHGTRQHLYLGCRTVGVTCVAFRGVGNRAANCIADDATAGFSAFNQYISTPGVSVTDDTEFSNCQANRMRGNATAVSTNGGGGRVTVSGGRFSLAAGSTSDHLFDTNGELVLRGVNIEVEGDLTDGMFRCEAGTTLIDLGDSTITLKGKSPAALITTDTTPPAVRWNGLTIHNANLIPALVKGATTIAAGTRFGAAQIAGGFGAVISALSDTVIQPFVMGMLFAPNRPLLTPTPAWSFADLGTRLYNLYDAERADLITPANAGILQVLDTKSAQIASQATIGARPDINLAGINSRASFEHDGTSEYFDAAVGTEVPSGTTPSEWWMLVRLDNAAAITATEVLARIGDSTSANSRQISRIVSGGVVNLRSTQGDGTTSASSTHTANAAGVHVVRAIFDAAFTRIDVDGVAGTASSAISLNTNKSRRRLGAATTSTANSFAKFGWNMFAETDRLSDAEAAKATALLMARAGL